MALCTAVKRLSGVSSEKIDVTYNGPSLNDCTRCNVETANRTMMSDGPNVPTATAVPSSVLICSNATEKSDLLTSSPCGSPVCVFQSPFAIARNAQATELTWARR
jgi:hypothetical protein